MSSTQQVVVITGAGRGLGEGMARLLAAKGHLLALLDRDTAHVEKVAADLPDARAWTCDVTDAAGLKQVAAQVQQHFGRVDVLVNNAGIGRGGPFLLEDEDEFERVLEINLTGSTRTVRAFLPALVESKGYLLQIASLAAFTPAPFMSAYCASKAGVEAYAHCLRSELKHHKVKVGVGYLAFTDTDMVREADADPALGTLRSSLPAPFGSTYPVEPAIERLVAGIEGRKAHVYAQRWLRVMPYLRGGVPTVIAKMPSRDLKRAEQLVRDRMPS
ncbi:MAG: short chain dehydrogenase [Frankiales bacterium]|nr:short chain dehydrogenase [Frankiales bacterium]